MRRNLHWIFILLLAVFAVVCGFLLSIVLVASYGFLLDWMGF